MIEHAEHVTIIHSFLWLSAMVFEHQSTNVFLEKAITLSIHVGINPIDLIYGQIQCSEQARIFCVLELH